jgi:hypothetical protein
VSALEAVGRGQIASLDRKRTTDIAAGMPRGVLDVAHRSVQSEVLSIQVPEQSYRCVLRGALGMTLSLDDGTLGVLDVAVGGSTRSARPHHAWAHALESSGAGKVSALGTLVFAASSQHWSWTPHERDDAGFYGFLAEALSLLERPAPPGGTPLCGWCVYRDTSRRTGF